MKKNTNFLKLLLISYLQIAWFVYPEGNTLFFPSKHLAPPSQARFGAAEKVILNFFKKSDEKRGEPFLAALVEELKQAQVYDSTNGINEAFIAEVRFALKAGKLESQEKEQVRALFLALPYRRNLSVELMRSLGIPLNFEDYREEQKIEEGWARDPQVRKLDTVILSEARARLVAPGTPAELNGVGAFVRLNPWVKGESRPKVVATAGCDHPFLTARAWTLLEFIAANWVELSQREGIPIEKSQLLVNDAARTEEDQRRLLALPNSTAAPFSSHLTGNTFDLWAKWFKYNDIRQARILLRIFAALQEAGVINLLDEGHVWHVAVNPYLDEQQLPFMLDKVSKKLLKINNGEEEIFEIAI